jgi:hypothetical protein
MDPFGLCPPTPRQRWLMAAQGLGNLAIGAGKIGFGATATAETGGLAVGLGIYGIVSGIGNLGAGISQIAGAASGNVAGGAEGAEAVAVALSPLGIGTMVATNGNLNAAATAAEVEGVLSLPFTAGLTGEIPTLPDAADAVQNGAELLRRGNNGPSGPSNSNCQPNAKCK